MDNRKILITNKQGEALKHQSSSNEIKPSGQKENKHNRIL
jgi:hypothetical protein